MFRRIKKFTVPIIIVIFFILVVQFDRALNIFAFLIFGVIAAFAAVILYFVVTGLRKEKRLKAMMSTVTADLPLMLRTSLENLGQDNPDGSFILKDIQHALSDNTDQNTALLENKIFLPETTHKFPWEGQSLHIQLAQNVNDLKFTLKASEDQDTTLGGRRFFHVPVPRRRLKNGSFRNRYDWDWIYKNSPDLRSGFETHFGEDGRAALNLFEIGEACFQSRTGTHPSWVQSQEYQKCDQCKQAMPLIAQIQSRHCLPKTDFTIYLFGCPEHLDMIKPVWQCT